MQDHPGFIFYEFARKEEPAPDDADPQLKAEWQRVARAFRKARRRWFVLDDRVRRKWDDVLDARHARIAPSRHAHPVPTIRGRERLAAAYGTCTFDPTLRYIADLWR